MPPRAALAVAFCVALASAGLTGCGDADMAAAPPPPAQLTAAAVGHYCHMTVVNHLGPKGQIHLPGREAPLWFSSVRDTIAFTMLPEEPKNATAVYVNDMGRASWDQPEPDTWVDARRAWYVIGSDRVGGMGAPETVPFAERDAAQAFAARHGGAVVRFEDIPEHAVLGSDGTHSAARHGAPLTHVKSPPSTRSAQ